MQFVMSWKLLDILPWTKQTTNVSRGWITLVEPWYFIHYNYYPSIHPYSLSFWGLQKEKKPIPADIGHEAGYILDRSAVYRRANILRRTTINFQLTPICMSLGCCRKPMQTRGKNMQTPHTKTQDKLWRCLAVKWQCTTVPPDTNRTKTKSNTGPTLKLMTGCL